jgi:hypothetical protein
MNKQEYNELNLIISYFALLVSNGDLKAMKNLLGWEHTLQFSNQLIKHSIGPRFFFSNNNIFLFKMLVTFLLQKPKLLMKYFILIFSYIYQII